jgi:hypothetical protein
MLSVPVADKPSSPRDVRVADHGEDWVQLAWTCPKDDGGSAVSGYTVERREALRMIWHDCGDTDDTTLRVGRLSPGASYVFRVTATNAQGTSLPEELTQAVAPKPAFGEGSTYLSCSLSPQELHNNSLHEYLSCAFLFLFS